MKGESGPGLGIIRVITSNDRAFVETHGRQIERAYPPVWTVSLCLSGQPDGVHDAPTEEAAAAKMPEAARDLAARGVDAIIVSCCSDPGVREAASAVAVPVVGAGNAAALASLAYGQPVGVLGLTGRAPRAVSEALGDRLAASAAPHGVQTTLDLLRPEAVAACEEAARMLLKQGAGVICLACTGTATIGLPRRLAGALGVPVIDPVLAAGGLALMMLAQLHRA